VKRTSRTGIQWGFTLVELTVTVLILAVITALGAPSLSRALARHRQSAAVQSLFSSFQFARIEAISRQRAVTICPIATESDHCGEDYAAGWKVYVGSGSDAVGSDRVIRRFASLEEGMEVLNRAGTNVAGQPVTWYPDGTARPNLTLQVCTSRIGPLEPMGLVLNGIGRARVARNEGDCP